MAQFGTIADWLRYDDIRMAMAERNLKGLAVGAIGQTIGRVVDETGDSDIEIKADDRKPEVPLDLFETFGVQKPIFDKTNPDPKDPFKTKIQLQKINEPPTPAEKRDEAQLTGTAALNSKPEEAYEIEKLRDITGRGTSSTSSMAIDPNNLKFQQQFVKINPKGLNLNVDSVLGMPRIKDDLDYEALAKAQAAPSYLQEIGAAAAEGYNIRVERDAYKRKAFDKAAEGLEDNFSKLQLEPSGFSSFDGTMRIMGKEMQKSFLDLEKMKYGLDPAQYLSTRSNILAQPKMLNSAITTLKQRVADFDANRDMLSKGNDSKTIDILDSLSKNEGTLKPEFINDIPYIVGKTAGGQDVSVPISEIANGKNDFKFLTKANINDPLNNLVNKYSKLKTEAEFKNAKGSGLKKTTLPVSAFKQSLMSDFDQILNSDAILRSVVADYMGADYDTFEEIKASGNDPKEMAKNQLYQMFEQKFDPYTQTQDITSYMPISTTQQKLTSKERTQKQIVDKIKSLGELSETNVNKYNAAIPTSMTEKGYKVAYKNGNPYIVRPDKKTGELKGTPFSMEAYSQILGTKPGALPILNK